MNHSSEWTNKNKQVHGLEKTDHSEMGRGRYREVSIYSGGLSSSD